MVKRFYRGFRRQHQRTLALTEGGLEGLNCVSPSPLPYTYIALLASAGVFITRPEAVHETPLGNVIKLRHDIIFYAKKEGSKVAKKTSAPYFLMRLGVKFP